MTIGVSRRGGQRGGAEKAKPTSNDVDLADRFVDRLVEESLVQATRVAELADEDLFCAPPQWGGFIFICTYFRLELELIQPHMKEASAAG